MWLLNASTRRLEYFTNGDELRGKYAILSHTWEGEEVTFDDIHNPEARQKAGYRKIEYSCIQTLKDRLTHVWVDTCCIDKRSSAELSEAINSMFRWYAGARVCYAYLSDVDVEAGMEGFVRFRFVENTRNARWYTRGWTLQELVAPNRVRFYSRQWLCLGEKQDLLEPLSRITRIDEAVISNRENLPLTSVARRMSWAAGRTTRRIEDRAYSLLGIFDVNLPLLYGEGRKAFQRLQEEIIRTASRVDHSILAWTPLPTELAELTTSVAPTDQLLALSPDGFRHAQNVVSWGLPQMQAFELSPRGLRLTCDVINEPGIEQPDQFLALNCRHESSPSTRLGIRLSKRDRIEGYDPEGIYDTSHVDDEPQYDRSWSSGPALDHLRIIDSDAIRPSSPIILARYRFLYPRSRDRVHIAATNSLRSKFQIWNLTFAMLQLQLHPHRSSGPATGSFILESNGTELNERSEIHIYVADSVARNRPLPLSVSYGAGVEKVEFQTGETKSLISHRLSDPKLAISARYVNLAGELLWSLRIELVEN